MCKHPLMPECSVVYETIAQQVVDTIQSAARVSLINDW